MEHSNKPLSFEGDILCGLLLKNADWLAVSCQVALVLASGANEVC